MITTAASNWMLDSLFADRDVWVQVHSGDPGADGTDNIVEAGRAAATFDPAQNAMVASSVTLEWVLPTNAVVSWVTLWDRATAGVLLGADPLQDPQPTAKGTAFRLPAAALTADLR